MPAAVALAILYAQSRVGGISARAKELFEATQSPGMTYAVILPDGTLTSGAFGLADKETKTPMRVDHRMPAGSTGKTFFAATFLQLVEEKRLDLDVPIAEYVGKQPWFAKLPNARALTLRNLLNHTSGIPEYVESQEFVNVLKGEPDKVFAHTDLLRFIVGQKPLFDAGKGWSYADANFVLAGVIVETALKIDLEAEIGRRLLAPLKLNSTIPNVKREIPGFANGYSMPNSPFLPEGPVAVGGKFKLSPQFEWAGGGYASTSSDLARWAKEFFSGPCLTNPTRRQMLDGVKARTGPEDKYGLGAMIEPLTAGVSYGHEGWFPGYLTQMAYFPDLTIAVAVQFNTDNLRALKNRTRYFIDELAKAAKAK